MIRIALMLMLAAPLGWAQEAGQLIVIRYDGRTVRLDAELVHALLTPALLEAASKGTPGRVTAARFSPLVQRTPQPAGTCVGRLWVTVKDGDEQALWRSVRDQLGAALGRSLGALGSRGRQRGVQERIRDRTKRLADLRDALNALAPAKEAQTEHAALLASIDRAKADQQALSVRHDLLVRRYDEALSRAKDQANADARTLASLRAQAQLVADQLARATKLVEAGTMTRAELDALRSKQLKVEAQIASQESKTRQELARVRATHEEQLATLKAQQAVLARRLDKMVVERKAMEEQLSVQRVVKVRRATLERQLRQEEDALRALRQQLKATEVTPVAIYLWGHPSK